MWIKLYTGSLYKETLSYVCKYRITETEKLIKKVNLIKGKFRIPKIKYLYRAIDQVNILYNANIEKLLLDISNI